MIQATLNVDTAQIFWTCLIKTNGSSGQRGETYSIKQFFADFFEKGILYKAVHLQTEGFTPMYPVWYDFQQDITAHYTKHSQMLTHSCNQRDWICIALNAKELAQSVHVTMRKLSDLKEDALIQNMLNIWTVEINSWTTTVSGSIFQGQSFRQGEKIIGSTCTERKAISQWPIQSGRIHVYLQVTFS